MGESETDTAGMPFGISEQSQRKESGNGKPEFSKWRTEIGSDLGRLASILTALRAGHLSRELTRA
jgi:hypothetical protein